MKHVFRFDGEFAVPLEKGFKTSTIRRKRVDGNDPLAGDEAAIYVDFATPRQRLITDTIIEEVTDIAFLPTADGRATILMGGHRLYAHAAERLASYEGFSDLKHMIDYFKGKYGLPFFGNLISWAGPPNGPGYTH